MGAVCADEGELYVADYAEYPEPSLRDMRKMVETINREPENLGSFTKEIETRAYQKPKVPIFGKERAWPAVIGPSSSHTPLIVHQDVAQALITQGFTGFALKEVHIRRFFPPQLLLSRRPRYFALETEKRIEYFLKIYEHKDGNYVSITRRKIFRTLNSKKSRESMAVLPNAKSPSWKRGTARTFFTWESGKVCLARWDPAASFWIWSISPAGPDSLFSH